MIRRSSRAFILGLSASALCGCSMFSMQQSGMSEQEKDAVSHMTPSQYQPATRALRDSIETQDLFAQAAFWSREYELNPSDLEAAVKLATAVRKMGNPGRAIEITQTTRMLYPNDPYLTAEYAAALIAAERGKEALTPLDGAIRIAPNYARLWSLKGAALDQIEQYDQARRHYNEALKLTPNDPNILANMGLSYALAGDAKTAEGWLRRAASMPGAGTNIHKNLELVMQLQGKTYTPPQSARMHSPNYAATAPGQTARGQFLPPANTPGYSSMTVTGGSQAPYQSASDMARAAAAQSSRKSVTVPYDHNPKANAQAPMASNQPQYANPYNNGQAYPNTPSGAQKQSNIFSRINRSLTGKQRQATQTMPPNHKATQTPPMPQPYGAANNPAPYRQAQPAAQGYYGYQPSSPAAVQPWNPQTAAGQAAPNMAAYGNSALANSAQRRKPARTR